MYAEFVTTLHLLPHNVEGPHLSVPRDQGTPSYCVWARTRVVILNYALKSRAAGPLRSGVHLAGLAAPDLLSARGRVR